MPNNEKKTTLMEELTSVVNILIQVEFITIVLEEMDLVIAEVSGQDQWNPWREEQSLLNWTGMHHLLNCTPIECGTVSKQHKVWFRWCCCYCDN